MWLLHVHTWLLHVQVWYRRHILLINVQVWYLWHTWNVPRLLCRCCTWMLCMLYMECAEVAGVLHETCLYKYLYKRFKYMQREMFKCDR